MRIIMIGQKGIPASYGGIERHVEDLSRELVKRGHEVLAYAREWYTPEIIRNFHGIRVIHTPTIHTKHLDAFIHTLTSTLHALFQEPDVIHYHGVGPSLLSWIPRLILPRTKVIATFHCIDRYHQKWGYFAKLMLRLGEWATCRFPHETIVVSQTIQNYCLNEYHKNTNHITNGISLTHEPLNAEWLSEWNLEPNKYVLMVSRLIRHKGAHYLIEAWQFARREYPELLRDHKLVITGDSSFTDRYMKELRRLARDDKSIVFTGWQSGAGLISLYAHAKLLVHPSENEGTPITVLQAMALGKAVLLSDIPEHKEVVTDSSFWFSTTSIGSLADKLMELLGNQKLLNAAGKENKNTVKNKYNWEKLTDEVLVIYGQGKEYRRAAKLKTA